MYKLTTLGRALWALCVQMPLAETFWSPCYGMVTDQFKVGWMVMVPGESA